MTETLNRDVRADSEAAFTERDGDRILTWRWPWLYRVLFRLSPTSQRVRAKEIDAVLARIDAVSRPGQSVIEVGCGHNKLTGLANRRGFAHRGVRHSIRGCHREFKFFGCFVVMLG